MKLLRIIPDGTKFPFMAWRRISFPLSALLSVITIVLFFTVNMNFGIDFTGGTLVEMRAKSGQVDVAKVRTMAEQLHLGEVEVQEFKEAAEVSLRFPLQPGGDKGQQVVVEKSRAAFQNDFDFRRVEVVGPRISGELVQAGTLGVVASIIGVLIYLWFRFEWQFAVGAVIATLHDLMMIIGFYLVSQIEFNSTSIAAILTIVGYSVNDTVVVFDRIRELLRRYKKMPINELLDLAINQTLARTFLVSFTAMLSLLALVIFGGNVISSFSWAMFVGVIVGTYSSIFIAAPVLIYLGLKVGGDEPKAAKDEAKAKAA
ncbi:MAG: protein translocase subunit SecF [Proteobacteria bacterium]|nr:protein translocase subunit SecF [Pseudomonadota bacterium]